MISPETVSAVTVDPQELSSHAHALQGFLREHHLLLSDAAVALDPDAGVQTALEQTEKAIEAFEQAEQDIVQNEGWWKAYLNVFKTAIEFVHDKIDGPIHQYTPWEGGTWGFSIALFTASVRACLVPLSIQQSKSTEMIKALKPYVDKINEKFKDNEERKNMAVGKLYEDTNQNPLSGCLFSLLQIPVFLGLYRGVRLLAMDGKLNEPFLWIPSLEGPVGPPDYRGLDWLTQGWTQNADGFWQPQMGWETTLAFCVMPVVLVLGQRFTMETLTPPEAEPDPSKSQEELDKEDQTKTILKFLPLLIGFFSLQVPAGLTIYWFTSNGFTLSQALLVRKYYEANPPEIELPDYWDALDDTTKTEKEMTGEERRAAVKAGILGPTMEDWIDEAKFHTLVERKPLRKDSESWKKFVKSLPSSEMAATSEDSAVAIPAEVIPAELVAWVALNEQLAEINGKDEANGVAHANGNVDAAALANGDAAPAPVSASAVKDEVEDAKEKAAPEPAAVVASDMS